MRNHRASEPVQLGITRDDSIQPHRSLVMANDFDSRPFETSLNLARLELAKLLDNCQGDNIGWFTDKEAAIFETVFRDHLMMIRHIQTNDNPEASRPGFLARIFQTQDPAAPDRIREISQDVESIANSIHQLKALLPAYLQQSTAPAADGQLPETPPAEWFEHLGRRFLVKSQPGGYLLACRWCDAPFRVGEDLSASRIHVALQHSAHCEGRLSE